MDKGKFAKYTTAAVVTTGTAIALPAIAPFVAPFILPLITGILSESAAVDIGKSGVEAIKGILGNLASSAIWESPNPLGKNPENQDLLRLLVNAYLKAIKELDLADDENSKEQADIILPLVQARLEKAIGTKKEIDLIDLFPLKKDSKWGDLKYSFANRISADDIILKMADEKFVGDEIFADEIETSIRRWFSQEKSAERQKESGVTALGLSDESLPEPLRSVLRGKLSKSIPKKIGELLKQPEFQRAWIAFQRSHLQAVLKEIKNSRNGFSDENIELFKSLAENLSKLAHSDFPEQLADSTATILSRASESEENIKKCIREEKAKLQNYLQDYLAGMESRIIKEFHKISFEYPLPNSIPPSIDFIGREEDYLQEIREQYRNGNRIFIFHGIGGVGKTALALKFADEIKNEYQAKAFVDMQGLTNPLSARNAMFEIVKQFNPEVRTDISESDLDTEFKNKVQNQLTLIALDNAQNKQSVESLKVARACLIITSRETFNLTGGIGKHIEKMSPNDARNLLFKIADKERFDEQADALAELAGYLPMALKPLASILAEDELETLRSLKERYKNKKKLLEERVPDYKNLTIEASFELSYEALSAEMKDHWRRLSVFPADFDEAAMAAVLNLAENEAKKAQKLLRKYSLLEIFTKNPPRFNLHDLAREFCDSKLRDNERFEARFLFAKHYISVLQTARNLQESDSQNGSTNASELIDAELNNIRTGQKWSAKNLNYNNEISGFSKDYLEVFSPIASYLDLLEYIVWLRTGLKACQKIGDRQGEASISGKLGNAYLNWGLHLNRKTIKFLKKALEISREIGDRQGESKYLGDLGKVYLRLSENQIAIVFFGQALKISREIGDLQNESNYLGNLGIAYLKLLRCRKGIEFLEKALEISRIIGNRTEDGIWLVNLDVAYNILDQYRKAIETYKKDLKILRATDNHPSAGFILLTSLMDAHRNLGEYREAIDFCEQGLEICRKIGDFRGEHIWLNRLGDIYFESGASQKAIEFYEKALEISRIIDNREMEGNDTANLGITYYNLGKKKKACDLWKKALAFFEALESSHANFVRKLIEENCN